MSSAVAQAPTRIDVERLTSLGGRFRTWQMRQGGSIFKTPSYIWDEAFELVPLFGARRVARELGLSREDLLRRMNEEQQPAAAAAPAIAPSDPEFLEVEMEWPGIAMPPAPVTPTPAPPVARVREMPSPPPLVAADAAPAAIPTPLSVEEAWLEVVAADGDKMTLRIPVSHLASAAALVREFRTQR